MSICQPLKKDSVIYDRIFKADGIPPTLPAMSVGCLHYRSSTLNYPPSVLTKTVLELISAKFLNLHSAVRWVAASCAAKFCIKSEEILLIPIGSSQRLLLRLSCSVAAASKCRKNYIYYILRFFRISSFNLNIVMWWLKAGLVEPEPDVRCWTTAQKSRSCYNE
jgi:hypothetical protein